MSGHDSDFDANKVFLALFILTALEVAWGLFMPGPHWWVWGGLISMAFAKGLLILQYFMHFKFEGWIVKCLVAPTPFLIAYLWAILSTEFAHNTQVDEPIGAMVNPATGEVWVEMPRREHGHLVDDSAHADGAATD